MIDKFYTVEELFMDQISAQYGLKGNVNPNSMMISLYDNSDPQCQTWATLSYPAFDFCTIGL